MMKFTEAAQPTMDVDGGVAAPAVLLDADDTDSLLQQIISVKNRVIGNKRQKVNLINQGIIMRLLNILNDEQQPDNIRVESVIVLGSLAKSQDEHVITILSSGAIEVLIRGLGHQNVKYVELCLCCLRSLVQSPVCPRDFIYADPRIVSHLLSLVDMSVNAQACVATILAECCQKEEQQNYLHSKSAVEILLPALHSNLVKLEMAVLRFYACLCHQNKIVSKQMLAATYNDIDLQQTIIKHLGRDKPLAIRNLAAKCITYMYRSDAIPVTDPVITLKVMPTLVTMCKPDRSILERIEGAEMIACLTEVDVELQKKASITDHCIPVIASYFRNCDAASPGGLNKAMEQEKLHQAGLRAFASLAANDEDIRKRIIETENIMSQIARGLGSDSTKLQLAAARCLHSLSRSVQQLRTSFQDHAVWKPLMSILRREKSEELMNVASSTLCNLLLVFSPCKEPMLELGAIELLVSLTFSNKIPLRLNAVWALMNMAFQADQKVKSEIISKLGTDQLFCLLRDSIIDIVMKTLGLLRNLLAHKPHIDHIMLQSGEQVIQAVVMILESDHTSEIKEQTLCILGNVADGDASKEYIMNNDDILKKILDYMQHSNPKLQVAAVFCVCNLVWREEPGSDERHQKMRSMGAHKILQQLLNTSDKTLFEKVQSTLQQFS